jgi:kynurenine formamidase
MNLLLGTSIYDLEQPRYNGMPAFAAARPTFTQTLYRRHGDTLDRDGRDPRSSASGTLIASDHQGTHVDALCHQAEDMHLYGGIEVDSGIETNDGFTALGAETIPPIFCRGYLLDLARHTGVEALPEAYPIRADDLEACAQYQGVHVEPGAAILVRTGYGQFWDDPSRYLSCAGLSPDANQWVMDHKPLAVGADNLSWDLPGLYEESSGSSMYGHLLLIVRNGVYIFENLFLEDLATEKIHRFLFLAAPLKFVGATGAPVRPLALLAKGENHYES